jgi:DNA sulfur modification protein DndD
MRINKVILNNFRIYNGLNEIILKKGDPNNNISIIAGNNGFGKTTFLNALVWCFYGKLSGEVDEKYKREIYEAGGYKKYANLNLNRESKSSSLVDQSYSVEIELSEINIPTVPCSKIIIRRKYDIINESEIIKVIIDGFENELTKDVGPDIFINDFILPREIAKFFFFDAEKIVSLSEIKTLVEKKNLSKAYSEVLGINKYETLKKTLENLRIKLRKKSASLAERNKLESIQLEAKELEKLLLYNQNKVIEIKSEIERSRLLSEQYQEKLIREGNSISVDDLISLKKAREKLKENSIEIKSKLKDLLELVPFVIAGIKTKELYKQVQTESINKQRLTDNEYIEEKLSKIKNSLFNQVDKKNYSKTIKEDFYNLVSGVFDKNKVIKNQKIGKILVDLSEKEQSEFEALYDNIKHAFSVLFKQIVREEKNNRIFLTKTIRKISQSESKDSDIITQKYKLEKETIDKKIQLLNSNLNKIFLDFGGVQQNLATKSKLIAELSKNVSLDEIDSKKDLIIERLISELNDFIFRYKLEKKQSLENRIKTELQRLMHKENFIVDVDVELSDEIIDIHLFDKNGNVIEKDTLSKGEQQLYATALLKSLVDESEIQFPIFIDSPLQKFDKKHSKNIIKEFYPSISKQVILFPLLEKELTEREYALLLPHVNQTFIIKNSGEKSSLNECKPKELFNELELNPNVHSY